MAHQIQEIEGIFHYYPQFQMLLCILCRNIILQRSLSKHLLVHFTSHQIKGFTTQGLFTELALASIHQIHHLIQQAHPVIRPLT